MTDALNISNQNSFHNISPILPEQKVPEKISDASNQAGPPAVIRPLPQDKEITKIMEEVDALFKEQNDIDQLLKEIEQEEIANRQLQGAMEATQAFLGRIGSHTELGLGIEKQLIALTQLTNISDDILEGLKGLDKLEEFTRIAEISAKSINLLNLGLQGTSLILGMQVLRRSKRVFEEILDKNEAQQQKNLKDPTLTEEEKKNRTKTYESIIEKVNNWKEQIQIEEEALNLALFGFTSSSASTALSLLNQGISHIPTDMLPSTEALQLSKQILGGLGWALKGLEVIVLAVEIEHKKKQGKVLDSWMKRFDDVIHSQKMHIKIREQTKEQQLESLPKTVDVQKIKEQLENLINNHTESALKILRRLNIGLDWTVSNKKELKEALSKDDKMAARLVEAFTEIHQILRDEARQKLGDSLDAASQKKLDAFNKDKAKNFGRKVEAQLRSLSRELEQTEKVVYGVGVLKKSSQQKGKIEGQLKLLQTKQRADLENEFLALLNREDVNNTLQILNTLGANLDKSMTRDELIKTLENDENLYSTILEKFIAYKQKINQIDQKILTSDLRNTTKSLLKKRKLIEERKIELLKFSFDGLEDKIEKLHKNIFDQQIKTLRKLAEEDFDKFPAKENALLSFIEQRHEKWKEHSPSFQEEVRKGIIPESVVKAYNDYKDAVEIMKTDMGLRTLFSDNTILTEAKENLIKAIKSLEKAELESTFDSWYKAKEKDELLKIYVQHQETIERAVKAPLVQVINKKHTIERKVLRFNLTASKVYFTLSVASLALGASFGLIALLGTPLAAASAVLLFLSIGATIATLSSIIGGYYLGLKYKKRNTIDGLTRAPFQSLWRNMHLSLHRLNRLVKRKNMLKEARKLQGFHKNNLNLTIDQFRSSKEFKKYEKAKKHVEQASRNVKHWTQEIKKLTDRSTDYGWKDFVGGAKLQTAKDFDVLDSFSQALELLDEDFLGEDTKEILRVQLGINLKEAQKKITGTDNEAIKKSVQRAFARTGENLIEFMRRQVGMMKRKK